MTIYRNPTSLTKEALSEEDKQLWDSFVQGVIPTPTKLHVHLKIKKSAKQKKQKRNIDDIEQSAKRSANKGYPSVDARLDLHGLTQEQAYHRLHIFLNNAQSLGKKRILIITGKGKSNEPNILWYEEIGVLRRMVPQWLETPPNKALVASYQTAHPRLGGEGALYVLLRVDLIRQL